MAIKVLFAGVQVRKFRKSGESGSEMAAVREGTLDIRLCGGCQFLAGLRCSWSQVCGRTFLSAWGKDLERAVAIASSKASLRKSSEEGKTDGRSDQVVKEEGADILVVVTRVAVLRRKFSSGTGLPTISRAERRSGVTVKVIR